MRQVEVAQHAPEGQLQIGAGKDLLGGAVGEHRVLHQHRAVAELGHAAQVVGGDENHAAFVAQRLQQLDDGVLGLHVHPGEGFVQQDHLRLLGQRTGQEHALFLAA